MPRRPRSLTRTAATLALPAAVAVCAPAFAEEAPFPAPGFWAYPAEPGLSDAALAESCRTGFSLVFADGHVLSVLTGAWFAQQGESRPAMIDSEAVCTQDAAAGRVFCEGTLHDGQGGMSAFTTDTLYDRDPSGALRATTLVAESSAQVVTYPQPCPDDAVRAVLRDLLAGG